MQRSVEDFFTKNVKRKHDSADPNNIVTKSNVSEPVPPPAKKPKRPKNFQDNWLKEYIIGWNFGTQKCIAVCV